jgi:hypothetical protein
MRFGLADASERAASAPIPFALGPVVRTAMVRSSTYFPSTGVKISFDVEVLPLHFFFKSLHDGVASGLAIKLCHCEMRNVE